MKMVDFFAGIGCFSAAGHAVGFETIAALEINQAAADCYARHFPGVPNLGDIKTATPPAADLWTAGFPCTDLSPAGKRAGLDGKRSGLIWQFLELADALRPKWILLENSAGLLTVARGRNAWRLFAALDDIGYVGAWRIMDSRYFGVPQGRRRVFILARDSRTGGANPEEVLFDTEGGSRDAAENGEARDEYAAGAESRIGIPRMISFNADMIGITPVRLDSLSPTLNTGGHVSVVIPQAIEGSAIGSHLVRRFTPLECERIQGIEENWTAGQPDARRYHQIGNACPPPMIEWILRRLASTE